MPQPNSIQPRVGLALFSYGKPQPQTTKPYPTSSQLLHNQTRPNSVCNLISTQLEDSCQKKLGQLLHNQTQPNSVCHLISTSTRRFMHRTIISFVQPQPNSIQNKNNPIRCGTAPGNLVIILVCIYLQNLPKKEKRLTH